MISIITPTYNRANLIERMIESVIRQTYLNWELIIVDDGSTDETELCIKEYQDERIRYFYTENSGATDSRNYGVNQAKGDYIIFLDSDDEARNTWLEELMDIVKLENADIAFCGLEKYNEKGELLSKVLPQKLEYNKHILYGSFLSGTFLVLKEYFLDVGGYDIKLASGQHTELRLRLLPYLINRGINWGYTENCLLKVYIHKGPRIRHNNLSIYQGSLSILTKHKEYFDSNPTAYYYFYSVAGVAAIRSGYHKEGRKLLLKAFKKKPYKMKALLRYMISHFPEIRNKIWVVRNNNI
ncbi:glycosyltransferase family 2 protein [Salegentibacter sediminis]|uniref:glycosyltransferase family 2 protein n=1 Tax=Salegentibacter sediminis TaxID=1930251 RepID=UPI0009C16403|nr:glycosyltransferase family 2 protein [Salegentibacter sediminis]